MKREKQMIQLVRGMTINKLLMRVTAVCCGVCVKYILIPVSLKLTEIELDLMEEL